MANFDQLIAQRSTFEAELAAAKAAMPDIPWYPYGTLNNIGHLHPLITPEVDALFAGKQRIADFGGADGDLSFFLETIGHQCDIYDFGPTNYNTLRGARAMQSQRNSSVQINEIDLDAQFKVEQTYDLAFFLGLLYHLKNPYYALEQLAKMSRFAFISTRIAQRFNAKGPDISDASAAYLLGPAESNNDATNYWIFTDAGLRRILDRCGWNVVSFIKLGPEESNPQENDADQRAFCCVRSRYF